VQDTEKKRILIVEDDDHIAQGLKLNLVLHGYEADIAATGTQGLQMWRHWNPQLIILDIMLPGLDGLSVLRHIRLEDEKIPILILSAKGNAEDKVAGFSCGVDDYLAKPFHLEEFMLRVDRLLTRSAWGQDQATDGRERSETAHIYRFGGNTINFTTMMAEGRHGTIQLTDQEVKLLKLFVAHRGKPLSRKELLNVGWGYTGITATRTIDNFIVRLRKYFEDDPEQPVYFKTIRSVGYVFDHPLPSK
jgi:DNA-binding response OmpR family regulator